MGLPEIVKKYDLVVNKKISLPAFYNTFSNDDECLELYFTLKYSGCNCRKCGRSIVENYKRIRRKNKNGIPKKAFRCRSCHTFIYPLSDTIFRRSRIPITDIFYAIFSFTSKSSTSALLMSSWIGVTYKTAHRLMMLVRTVLYNNDKFKMKGVIEVDEAFIGTGNKMYNWSGISTRKKPIIGLIERETKQVRLFLVPNRNAATINAIIRANVDDGSTIYTDSWKGYNGLSAYYQHEIVNHANREYVRGAAHTNNIENVWSKFKNNIRKAHIKISDKYVHLYLNEACWRYNSNGKLQMQLFNEILIRASDLTVT